MGLLDALIYGLRDVLDEALTVLPRRSRVKVVGATVTDDQENDAIVIDVSGGGGGGGVPGGGFGAVQFHKSDDTFEGALAYLGFPMQRIDETTGIWTFSSNVPIYYDYNNGNAGAVGLPFELASQAVTSAQSRIGYAGNKINGTIRIQGSAVLAGASTGFGTGPFESCFVYPFTHDGSAITIGARIDYSDPSLAPVHAALALEVVAVADADGYGNPGIKVQNGGDDSRHWRWSGLLSATFNNTFFAF